MEIGTKSSSGDQVPAREGRMPFLEEEPQCRPDEAPGEFEKQTLRRPASEQSRNVL
jgi:hypothetical protein